MEYQPVITRSSAALSATALVGANSVALGFDLRGGPERRAGLLGFAIERTSLADGVSVWARNPLKFARAPYAGYQVAGTESHLAPFQQFRWLDEAATPGAAYRYTIWSVFGTPARPELRDSLAIELRAGARAQGELALIFNRGVLATPAYRQRFDNARPASQPPELRDQAEAYLSRGLLEGALAFIGGARAGDALDLACYELEHPAILGALAAATRRGARVRVVYHARADTAGRENAAAMAALARDAAPGLLELRPRTRARLSHNKLIVVSSGGVARRVWTGSTNFTDSGLFLQTNVGIALRSERLAAVYARYIDLLARDLPLTHMRREVAALTRGAEPASPRLLLSPVASAALLHTAVRMIRGARQAVLISCPFGLDPLLAEALRALDPRVLVYGLLNTNQSGDLEVLNREGGATRTFVVPDWIRTLNGASYDASTGPGNQVHVKSLVVDPWGPRPDLLIGSANFSDESAHGNDENMLQISGDRWAAALAATEFLRVFDHYRFRSRLQALAEPYDTQRAARRGALLGERDDAPVWLVAPDDAPEAAPAPGALLGFSAADIWLDERGVWQQPYLEPGGPRARERAIFSLGDLAE